MPLDRIRDMTDLSIRRGCGFAAIGIGTTMAGFSFDGVAAFRVGALGASFALLVLLGKAWHAPQIPYRRTEVWELLGRSHGLPEPRAQPTIAAIRRERFLWHAQIAAAVALGFWALAFLLWLLR